MGARLIAMATEIDTNEGRIMEFAGTSAIVTGGGSGLGEATARLLANRGLHVVVLDLNSDKGRVVAAEIGGTFRQVNVADPAAVVDAIEVALAVGPLTVAVNCAGIGSAQRTIGRDGSYGSAHDLDAFRKVIGVNLVGTFNVSRLAATAMSRNNPDADGARGAILNTTSIAAFEGQVGQIAYSASKGGVVSMTLNLARDLAPVGVRVNTIAPGLIDTPIYGTIGGEDADAFKAHLAKDVVFPKRLGKPSEFASLAWEMITNPYLNGEVVRLDGGVRLPPK